MASEREMSMTKSQSQSKTKQTEFKQLTGIRAEIVFFLEIQLFIKVIIIIEQISKHV